jgi:hypothetical protein
VAGKRVMRSDLTSKDQCLPPRGDDIGAGHEAVSARNRPHAAAEFLKERLDAITIG